jgi:hypothetical protein
MTTFATVLELIGLAMICVAAWLLFVPLGLAVTGVALFAVGWFLER